jgi:5-methylcytosine-specific restriction endonuclease McrA
VDRHHVPLMPCSPARARALLRQGRAVVHRHTPFVIRLKDRTAAASAVAGIELGVDPGSRCTGIAAFRAASQTTDAVRHGLFSIELTHRGEAIHNRLAARATLRRRRRTRNLRYRTPRFENRSRPNYWLAPSLQHRVDTTMSWVIRLMRWAPVRTIHVETAAFDTHALSSEGQFATAQYQHGTLEGTEVREYLLAKWNRTCAYCHATGVPLTIDHVRPRSQGGSDRVSNLVLACAPCNQKKNSRSVEEFLHEQPNELAKILSQTKVPLRHAAAINATRTALLRSLSAVHDDVRSATGGRTKWNRQRTRTPKSHTLDALCVGVLEHVARRPAQVLAVAATGRGIYQRTTPDRYGFPRLTRPRAKQQFGFSTGDLVRASVPTGKKRGVYTGRVAIRSTGYFNVKTRHGLVQGVHQRHVRLLQRADGYAYITRTETTDA